MNSEERYDQWKEIGAGAFGSVYKVYDRMLQRWVAIKLLKEQYRNDATLVEALQREVIISRDLRHPNICPIHDVYMGSKGTGTVMDLIDGIELAKWLEEHKGHRLETLKERFMLFKRLVEALAFAHTYIVHRDMKPANVFLIKGDPSRPVIMDFGASVVGGGNDGIVAGTPKYMSPEQVEAPEKVDKRSDLFSLGIMAYEFFTDTIPETSLRQYLKTRIIPKPSLSSITPPSRFCSGLPRALDRLILQLMAYRQEDRPQSAEEVLQVLNSVKLDEVTVIDGADGDIRSNALRRSAALPGGILFMGSRTGQTNERPVVKVTLSPYRIALFPVTNAEYMQFLQTTGYAPPPRLPDPVFHLPDHPVVAVTYDDALAYAHWAGGSLPTEAQWEFAAKGGVKFPQYPWGDDPPSAALANIDGISNATSPVDGCPAGKNPYGLYDLCGNVWEWCLDAYDAEWYAKLDRECQDPCNTKPTEARRVLRGGSFDAFATQGRCTFRFFASRNERSQSIGFRLVFPA
ncbi:MAG: SUMF1/EgtB/PvdO family nonheme iron enzyme [Magnetococcales bacterium]|nr:SUMF1/EgtB/PvdO family nonheme iron enzyme [Magnetococcales bacterium]